MVVVIGTFARFKTWADKHPELTGKYLPKSRRFETALHVYDEGSAMKALTHSPLLELIILSPISDIDLVILRRKISVDKLLSR